MQQSYYLLFALDYNVPCRRAQSSVFNTNFDSIKIYLIIVCNKTSKLFYNALITMSSVKILRQSAAFLSIHFTRVSKILSD
jgi:hypothetical protein